MNREELAELAFEYSWKVPFRTIERKHNGIILTMSSLGVTFTNGSGKRFAMKDIGSIDYKELTVGLENEIRGVISLMDEFIDTEFVDELSEAAADKLFQKEKATSHHSPQRHRSKRPIEWPYGRYLVFVDAVEKRQGSLIKAFREGYLIHPAFKNVSLSKVFHVPSTTTILDVRLVIERGRLSFYVKHPSVNMYREPVRGSMKIYLCLPDIAAWISEVLQHIGKKR